MSPSFKPGDLVKVRPDAFMKRAVPVTEGQHARVVYPSNKRGNVFVRLPNGHSDTYIHEDALELANNAPWPSAPSPAEDGTPPIVTFAVTSLRTGITYSYAAIGIGTQWYTTAGRRSIMTWDGIVALADPGSIYLVTELSAL